MPLSDVTLHVGRSSRSFGRGCEGGPSLAERRIDLGMVTDGGQRHRAGPQHDQLLRDGLGSGVAQLPEKGAYLVEQPGLVLFGDGSRRVHIGPGMTPPPAWSRLDSSAPTPSYSWSSSQLLPAQPEAGLPAPLRSSARPAPAATTELALPIGPATAVAIAFRLLMCVGEPRLQGGT